MKIYKKKILLSILTLGTQFKASDAYVYHADSIEHGVILHAFSWSFNTIKEKLPDIKKAGYTAIQTSPIQECRKYDESERPLMHMANWKYVYQPISQNLGNFIVGTEEDFISLCEEAKKYEIKIIVDAVLNHMAKLQHVSAEWKDESLYHKRLNITDYSNRCEVTKGEVSNLRDINTESKSYQKKALDLLKRIVGDGAAGFRYDTAKHIALPDDKECKSDFWPNVLDNGSEFQYGEVLQDEYSRDEAYGKYMRVTASNYGYVIREAIKDNNFSINKIMDYCINVNSDKIITWIESHDNYTHNQSHDLTNEHLKLAWALIASRKHTTPLFFSRPFGGGGDNLFPGFSHLGDEGDPLYKDDTIRNVNLFRNAMVGEKEYLRNPDPNDAKVLMIERGQKGAVIINLHSGNYILNSPIHLVDGDYENHIDRSNIFRISGGKISGTLPGRSVVVLYNVDNMGPTVGIEGFHNNKEIPFKTDSIEITLKSVDVIKSTYSINGKESNEYSNGEKIKIGQDNLFGDKITVTLEAFDDEGLSVKTIFTFIKKDPNAFVNIYFQKPNHWGNNINAYIYLKNGLSTKLIEKWPGKGMNKEGNDIYSISFDDEFEGSMIIFNDGNHQSPGNGQDGFKIINNSLYNIDGFVHKYNNITSTITISTTTTTTTTTTTVSPAPSPSNISLYFEKPNNWGSNINAYIYTKNNNVIREMKGWPGIKMNLKSNNIYTLTFDKKFDGGMIIFNDSKQQSPGSGKDGFKIMDNSLYNVNGYVRKFITTTTTTTITTTTTVVPTIVTTTTSTTILVATTTTTTIPTIITPSTTTTTTVSTVTSIPSSFNIIYIKPSSWGSNVNVYIYKKKGSVVSELSKWPGKRMTNEYGNTYTVNIPSEYKEALVIFNDGSKQAPGSGESGFAIKVEGLYEMTGFTGLYRKSGSEEDKNDEKPINGNKTVTIYFYTKWSSANIHYQKGTEKWTELPGVKMESYNNDYKKIIIEIGNTNTMNFVFNDGNNQWDNNHGNNYYIDSPGSYIIKNGKISTGEVE